MKLMTYEREKAAERCYDGMLALRRVAGPPGEPTDEECMETARDATKLVEQLDVDVVRAIVLVPEWMVRALFLVVGLVAWVVVRVEGSLGIDPKDEGGDGR